MSPKPVPAPDRDFTEHHRKLVARKAELVARLPKIEAHLRTQATPDALIEDQGSLHQNDAVLERLSSGDRTQLAAIEAALKRFETGEYGDCASCDRPIEPPRLLHLPWAPLCLRCAERAERR